MTIAVLPRRDSSWLQLVRQAVQSKLDAGLTQADLATATGVPESSTRLFMRGGTIKSIHFQVLAEFCGYELIDPSCRSAVAPSSTTPPGGSSHPTE